MEKVIKKLDKILKEVQDAKAAKGSSEAKTNAARAIKKARVFLAEVELLVEEAPAKKEVKEETEEK